MPRPHHTAAAAFACAALTTGGCQLTGPDTLRPADAAGFPALVLQHNDTRALVMLPDPERGWYRGTRFAWHGMIRQLEHRGHSFFGYLHAEHNPTHHDAVSGPAPEFDITGPASFHDASPGESFVKIGVGRLQRDDNERYRFWHKYPILDHGQWHVDQPTPDTITMRQTLPAGDDGYAYELTQQLRLSSTGLEITYELHNTGQRAIATEFYHHNFFSLDSAPVGPGYELALPASAQPDADADLEPWAELATPEDDQSPPVLRWREPLPPGEAIYVQPHGFDHDSRFRFALRHVDTGLVVTKLGQRPLHRLAVWSSQPVICPEPFVMIELDPGEREQWAVRYIFSANDDQ